MSDFQQIDKVNFPSPYNQNRYGEGSKLNAISNHTTKTSSCAVEEAAANHGKTQNGFSNKKNSINQYDNTDAETRAKQMENLIGNMNKNKG